jgi:hypothetical protein
MTTMSVRRVPAPPRPLLDAMGAASKAGDTTRFNVLHAEYMAWLVDNGHTTATGTRRPDGAIR